MKKLFATFLATVMCTASVFASPFVEVCTTPAEDESEVLYKDGTTKRTTPPVTLLYINGDAVYNADPVIKNGTTLVPLRYIAELYSCDVDWDAEKRSVEIEKGELEIECSIGANTIFVNDMPVNISNSAEIIDQRTYVPIRAISDAFGAEVYYVQAIAPNTNVVAIETENVFTRVTKEDAVTIAEKRYFEDFLPTMADYLKENFGITHVDKSSLEKGEVGSGIYRAEVKADMGRYWYVTLFEDGSCGALIDKNTGKAYAVHRFSLVDFSVAEEGDYSGWCWNFQ